MRNDALDTIQSSKYRICFGCPPLNWIEYLIKLLKRSQTLSAYQRLKTGADSDEMASPPPRPEVARDLEALSKIWPMNNKQSTDETPRPREYSINSGAL